MDVNPGQYLKLNSYIFIQVRVIKNEEFFKKEVDKDSVNHYLCSIYEFEIFLFSLNRENKINLLTIFQLPSRRRMRM